MWTCVVFNAASCTTRARLSGVRGGEVVEGSRGLEEDKPPKQEQPQSSKSLRESTMLSL